MENSKLILLEENVNGYGKGNKKPTGHVTIAMPGIIKCYVQDLLDKEGEKYILYLFSKGKNKAVRIGEINALTDNKQTIWQIEGLNIGDSGLHIKDIDCAALVIEGVGIGNTDVVVIGYTGGKYLITTLLQEILPQQPTVQPDKVLVTEDTKPIEDIPTVLPDEFLVEEIEDYEADEVDEEIENESGNELSLAEEIQKVLALMSDKTLDNTQAASLKTEKVKQLIETHFTKEDIQQEKAHLEGQIKEILMNELNLSEEGTEEVFKEMTTAEDETDYVRELKVRLEALREKECQKEDPYLAVREIYDHSKPTTPFEEDAEPIDWVRIETMSELRSMPQLSCDWCTQPFVTQCYHTYRHFILGKDREMEQYYLGVPDKFNATRSSILTINGVERFKPCSGENAQTDECGYWIVLL